MTPLSPSPEAVWSMNDQQLSDLLDNGRLSSRHKRIRFYAPSFTHYKTSLFHSSPTDFPTISVTGQNCALNCGHCGGTVLSTMHPATTPEKLLDLCRQLKREGALGCLVSGGCLPNGSVPLNKFADVLRRVKHELNLTVLVHTGIVDSSAAKALKEAEIDAALIDIIGSDHTIKAAYNLSVTVKDYSESLRVLSEAKIVFVPHVIVGLDDGKLRGELQALRMIAEHRPSALVIIAFMPLHGTRMAGVEPPRPLDIAKVVACARLMFPETPLTLGCMRAKGKLSSVTDVLAIKAGVDAIAFPAEEAITFAKVKEFRVDFSSVCCAQAYLDLRDSAERTE